VSAWGKGAPVRVSGGDREGVALKALAWCAGFTVEAS
jgi:hypothetical protein